LDVKISAFASHLSIVASRLINKHTLYNKFAINLNNLLTVLSISNI